MLITIITAILPLAIAVLLGFIGGRYLSATQLDWAGRSLTPIVWGILWVIGVSTGATLNSFAQGLASLKLGALFAAATSITVIVLLVPFSERSSQSDGASFWQGILHPLKEASIAFSLVGLGIACFHLGWRDTAIGQWLFDIDYWLFILLLVIGIELTHTEFDRSWLAWPVLRVPLLVIVGSLIGGLIVSLLTDIKPSIALALSSGFGWFSLSGALASQHLGESYGAIALLTDLMRELLGILIVFMLGNRFAQASVGVCGATSADTTLPFIRQACGQDFIPVALMSGLVLTLSGPFLMLFFMKLA